MTPSDRVTPALPTPRRRGTWGRWTSSTVHSTSWPPSSPAIGWRATHRRARHRAVGRLPDDGLPPGRDDRPRSPAHHRGDGHRRALTPVAIQSSRVMTIAARGGLQQEGAPGSRSAPREPAGEQPVLRLDSAPDLGLAGLLARRLRGRGRPGHPRRRGRECRTRAARSDGCGPAAGLAHVVVGHEAEPANRRRAGRSRRGRDGRAVAAEGREGDYRASAMGWVMTTGWASGPRARPDTTGRPASRGRCPPRGWPAGHGRSGRALARSRAAISSYAASRLSWVARRSRRCPSSPRGPGRRQPGTARGGRRGRPASTGSRATVRARRARRAGRCRPCGAPVPRASPRPAGLLHPAQLAVDLLVRRRPEEGDRGVEAPGEVRGRARSLQGEVSSACGRDMAGSVTRHGFATGCNRRSGP